MSKYIRRQDLYNYKRKAVRAAKDLLYPDEVIIKIKSAQTEAEVERLMRMTREVI